MNLPKEWEAIAVDVYRQWKSDAEIEATVEAGIVLAVERCYSLASKPRWRGCGCMLNY